MDTAPIRRFQDIPRLTENGQWECDFPPDRLIKFVDENAADHGLQLCPDFQRGHVWTEAQQVAFVEFFLRGGKTGRVVYLNDPNWQFSHGPTDYADFVVVDGLQRLTAFRRFLADEFRAFGSLRSEFTDNIRLTNTMKVNINTLPTRAAVLQWYLEMNAGGTPHADAEIERVRGLLRAEAVAASVGVAQNVTPGRK